MVEMGGFIVVNSQSWVLRPLGCCGFQLTEALAGTNESVSAQDRGLLGLRLPS
jgi:hypothetical protein